MSKEKQTMSYVDMETEYVNQRAELYKEAEQLMINGFINDESEVYLS